MKSSASPPAPGDPVLGVRPAPGAGAPGSRQVQWTGDTGAGRGLVTGYAPGTTPTPEPDAVADVVADAVPDALSEAPAVSSSDPRPADPQAGTAADGGDPWVPPAAAGPSVPSSGPCTTAAPPTALGAPTGTSPTTGPAELPEAADQAPLPPATPPAPAGAPGIRPRFGAPGHRAPPLPGTPLTPDGIPKLTRSRRESILGGVAAGLAEHLRVPVVWVRLTFVLLALMAGSGVLAYALLWIFVPPRPEPAVGSDPGPARPATPTGARERRQALGIAAVGVAALLVAAALDITSVVGWVLGPLGLAALGGAFIWREADSARRARWRRTAAGIVGPSRGSVWRLAGGAVLVIGGLSVFAVGQLEFSAVRSALIAVLLTLVGVAVITVPWWIRLVRDLGTERQARLREAERAEIAAHLHDSVLQTLALIQRQSGDSREVLRLARGQERELRTWLYGPTGYATAAGPTAAAPAMLSIALAQAAGEVEDTYAVAVAPVVVGDAPMSPPIGALVAAAREAMVNAAKHSGADEISVYAEVEQAMAGVFVRDRGTGFDVDAVGADRRGLVESIRGRMDRHGGRAVVRSTPGEGTEVELTMPVPSGGGDPPLAPAGSDGPVTPAPAPHPTRGVQMPGAPSPGVRMHGVPPPGVPSPGVPSPGVPSPGVQLHGVGRTMTPAHTDPTPGDPAQSGGPTS